MILKGNRQKHITMKKTRLFNLLALLMVCAVSCNNSKSINGHEYVDLGLPSGTLWATCNVGAKVPEGYGDYFAWGEIKPKEVNDKSNYQYLMGRDSTFTKYCCNSLYGNNGFTDSLTILMPEDDAATANWGSDWQTPSKEQWDELLDNTTNKWTTQNGVNGLLLTGKSGQVLFIPAAGGREYGELIDTDSDGYYMSRSLCTDLSNCAWGLDFFSKGYAVHCCFRWASKSVRPVTSSH